MVRRVKNKIEDKDSVHECVAYIRVSTKSQAESGMSLETQRKMITDYCNDAKNYCHLDPNRIYVDAGISAFKNHAQRKGFQNAKIDIEKGRADTLIIYSLSRAFRSVKECVSTMNLLQKHDANIISVTEQVINTTTKTGRFVYYLFGILSQFESEQISERVTDNMLHAFEERGFVGGYRPTGYEFIKEWVEDKINGKTQRRLKVVKPYYKKQDNGEREKVERIFELYKSGMGQGKIGKEVGINGSVVGRILSNPTYAGFVMWNAANGDYRIMKGWHEAYTTREEFNRTVNRRVRQAMNHFQKKNPPFKIKLDKNGEPYLDFVKIK